METAAVRQIDWAAALQRVFPFPHEGIIKANTDEWITARRGRCTASKRAETIAIGKPAQWAQMAVEIEYELSDNWVQSFKGNEATQWGHDHEAEAVANVELEFGEETTDPGFILHPQYTWAGATPDFFLGEDTTGQIKCPFNPRNHLKFVYDQTLPSTYYHQVHWEAWVSQREHIIFMSYDPRQPISTRCAIIEMDANKALWKTFDSKLAEFKERFETGRKPVATFREFIGIPEIF